MLDLLAAFIGAIRIDPARVAENIRRSCITITELADSLVRIEGLSFRQAHEIAARVARAVVAMGGGLEKDGFEPFLDAFRESAGREPSFGREKFEELVSPQHFVAVRDRLGGPAPTAMNAALARHKAEADRFKAVAFDHAAAEAKAARELNEKFSALVEAR